MCKQCVPDLSSGGGGGGGPGDEANNETSASTRFRSAGEIKSSQDSNLGLLIGKNIYA